MDKDFDVVTGAFGFLGAYLAARLLARGRQVNTLTGHPERQGSLTGKVKVSPFHFERPEQLAKDLEGAKTLYNTYWIRFERGAATFDLTLERTRILAEAAARAGVRHLVQFSSVGADERSDLPYFRAKAEAEKLVAASFPGVTIIRPTLMFGVESLLFNNLAWMLKKMPVFAVCGRGDYLLQPVYVDDVAAAAVTAEPSAESRILEIGGPETCSYRELLQQLAAVVGARLRVLQVRMERLMQMTSTLAHLTDDVLMTRDEAEALVRGMLVASGPAAGSTRLSSWLEDHGQELGKTYQSVLDRYYR